MAMAMAMEDANSKLSQGHPLLQPPVAALDDRLPVNIISLSEFHSKRAIKQVQGRLQSSIRAWIISRAWWCPRSVAK